MMHSKTAPDKTTEGGIRKGRQEPEDSVDHGEAGHTAQDDLVDAGSEYSFPASDPPSYMGGTAIAGAPPRHGEPPREGVSQELIDPDEAKPAEDAPQGTDPARVGKAPSRPGSGSDQ